MQSAYALVGTQHREKDDPGISAFLKGLPDGEPLTLIREPDNRYDARAVQVWAQGRQIGYIAAKQNRDLAMAMDRMLAQAAFISEPADPVKFAAKLSTRNGERWPLVIIEEGS